MLTRCRSTSAAAALGADRTKPVGGDGSTKCCHRHQYKQRIPESEGQGQGQGQGTGQQAATGSIGSSAGTRFLSLKLLLLGALMLLLAWLGPSLLALYSAARHLDRTPEAAAAMVPAQHAVETPKLPEPLKQQPAQELHPSGSLPPPVFNLSEGTGGMQDNRFARRKQQAEQQQRPEASNPLYHFLQKKQEREQQVFTTATRSRVTTAALSKDPALTLPTRVPVAARLVVGYAAADGVSGDVDVELTLCEMDMAVYHRDPAAFPTLADLTDRLCAGGTGAVGAGSVMTVVRASELATDAEAGPQLEPAGFILHQTPPQQVHRIGAVLASVPTNLVLSEPGWLLALLRECEVQGLSEAARVGVVRAAVLSMGRSRHHSDLFVELPPAVVPHTGVLLRAFPETPWTFVYYRDPAEALAVAAAAKGKAKAAMEHAAQVAALTATALEHLQSAGAKGYPVAVERTLSSAQVLDTVLPGHFGLPLPAADRAVMQEALDKAGNGNADKQAIDDDDVRQAAATHLQAAMGVLAGMTAQVKGRLAAAAALRAQEARVYERTGSRFFRLPHCPEEPEYPPEVPILDIVGNWNPDDVAIPTRHHSTLCRIDYQAERAKALRYRDAEVPFVVYNVPEFDETVSKWAQPDYLLKRLGPTTTHYPTEISKSNHFLYTGLSKRERELQSRMHGANIPTELVYWAYARWLDQARRGQTAAPGPERERARSHYYLRVSHTDNPMVEEDLTIYTRQNGSTLFLADPEKFMSIQCRFGMRGVVTEGHFDAYRNMVAVVTGTRRVVLAHPRNCRHAHLFPSDHLSARQSYMDWARPDLEKYPDFAEMRAHEVLLSAGEILYIPTWWLHYVVTLDMSTQCNSHCDQSGVGVEHVEECGFGGMYQGPRA